MYPKQFDAYGVPILSDKDIIEYAAVILKDYNPDLLKEPGIVNHTDFLEFYLGVTLEYHDIYCEDASRKILGATAFTTSFLPIFDRETMSIKNIKIRCNTIVLDNDLQEMCVGAGRFTALHEGAHWLLHTPVFRSGMKDELELFRGSRFPKIMNCERGDICKEYSGGRRTSREWCEHQADVFASNLAMPDYTVLPFARETLSQLGYNDGVLEVHRHDPDALFAAVALRDSLGLTYGVSKSAAKYKLKKLGILKDAPPGGICNANSDKAYTPEPPRAKPEISEETAAILREYERNWLDPEYEFGKIKIKGKSKKRN